MFLNCHLPHAIPGPRYLRLHHDYETSLLFYVQKHSNTSNVFRRFFTGMSLLETSP